MLLKLEKKKLKNLPLKVKAALHTRIDSIVPRSSENDSSFKGFATAINIFTLFFL